MSKSLDEIRERNKANRLYYTSRGICGKCGKRPVEPGRVKCFECLDADIDAHNRMMAKKSPDEKKAIADRRNASKRRLTAYRRENGLCTQCGRPVVPGKRLCLEHLAKKRRTKDPRWNNDIPRSMRPSLGLCWRCGKLPIMEDKTLCEACFADISKWARDQWSNPSPAQVAAKKKFGERWYRKMHPSWRDYEQPKD